MRTSDIARLMELFQVKCAAAYSSLGFLIIFCRAPYSSTGSSFRRALTTITQSRKSLTRRYPPKASRMKPRSLPGGVYVVEGNTIENNKSSSVNDSGSRSKKRDAKRSPNESLPRNACLYSFSMRLTSCTYLFLNTQSLCSSAS